MNQVSEQIEKNRILLRNIELLLSEVEIFDNDERRMLFAGFFRNSLSHFLSITILIEKKLHNSAFALVRVLFESIVRGQYMYTEFDDHKISQFYNGEIQNALFDRLDVMCDIIDKNNCKNHYSDIKERTYSAMCDYTHTGQSQIARNFMQDKHKGTIEANFDDNLILDTLASIYALVKLFATEFFKRVGLKQNGLTNKQKISFMEIYR